MKQMRSKWLKKQIRQLKQRREREEFTRKKIEAMEDAIPQALTKTRKKLERQIVQSEKSINQLKKLDIGAYSEIVWKRLEEESIGGKQEGSETPDLVRAAPDLVESAGHWLDELDASNEVIDIIKAVKFSIEEKRKRLRRKRKGPQDKKGQRTRSRLSKEGDPPLELGKRDTKRASRAEKWRQNQAEKRRSESRTYRIARARVAESVFLDDLSSHTPSVSVVRENRSTRRPSRTQESEHRNSTTHRKSRSNNTLHSSKTSKVSRVSSGPLHPSWEAKKRQQKGIVGFKGSKITFDD